MKAMILAAGRGSRMRPLTDHMPKPLLEVGGQPLIIWHLQRLAAAGFTEIVINLAWQGNQIPKRLGDGSQWGLTIQYSDEQSHGALETAGGIIKALDCLGDEPFFVINGDVWSDYSFDANFQLNQGDLCHLVLIDNPHHHPKGDFRLKHQRVLNDQCSQQSCLTFSGIAYYHPDLFKTYSQGKRALAPVLIKAMNNGQASGEHFQGDWQDIGTVERLNSLNQQLKRKPT